MTSREKAPYGKKLEIRTTDKERSCMDIGHPTDI
jgi:hypothetical protein